MMIQPAHNKDEVFGFEDYEEFEEPKIQRDDLRNPFWIEDKEVLNGPRGHLKTEEIDFWKGNILNLSIVILFKVTNSCIPGIVFNLFKLWISELIPKYLESFEKKFATQKEKDEDDKQKENTKIDLRKLRDRMVFTAFMINALYVVAVSFMQQEKDIMSLKWFFWAKGKEI